MASVSTQLDIAMSGITSGDFSLMNRLLTNPDSITPDENKTAAERLGVKGGFLSAITNLAMDPTVWVAGFLSSRFPTSQYLRGAIPSRFVGAHNEFSGISTVARTVEGFFRGSHIPGLVQLKMRREAEVLQIGNKMFDAISRRPNWGNEMPIVSRLLEGQSANGATPELVNVAKDLRLGMNDIWNLLKKTQKVSGGFTAEGVSRSTARDFTLSEAPRFLRDYLPHIPLLGQGSTLALTAEEALGRFSASKRGQIIGLAKQNPANVWKPNASGGLSSDYATFQNFMERAGGSVFSPRLFQRKRLGVTLNSSEGSDLFVTDLNVILQKYVHSSARTYALNAPLGISERALLSIPDPRNPGKLIQPSSEPILTQIINQGLDATGGKFSQRPVAGTDIVEQRLLPNSVNAPTLGALKSLTRSVRGDLTHDEVLFGNMFNSIRSKVSSTVDTALGRKNSLKLETAISSLESQSKDRQLTNWIVSFFYSTTLGLNPLSSIKNLLQPFLTTAPAIGIGPTLEGMAVLKDRLPKYARQFSHEFAQLKGNRNIPTVSKLNLALEKAHSRTFPELARTGIRFDPRAFELDETALVTDPFGKSKFKTYDDYMKFVLQSFTQTEGANQVVSFYGAKSALRKSAKLGTLDVPSNAPLEEFLDFRAADTVRATQFVPGPGSRTQLQSMIPAPLRMFTSFPVRLGNFFAESTVRGAMTDKQLESAGLFTKLLGGRNFGTVSRTYLAGRVINEGLREGLGVDMGDAVGLTGPFSNVIPSGKMIPALPMSPLPSLAFGLVSAAVSRDFKELQPLELPGIGEVPFPKSLLPGGIAVTRASRALRHYRPDLGGFVDDDERLMFRGDTPDLLLSMLGIPLEKQRREKEVIERLQANRLQVRKIRRGYALASRNFDTKEMGRLESQWNEQFPEFGQLGISRHDLRRYKQQSRLTAVQRMIGTLGSKASFLEGKIYQTDPDLIAGDPNQTLLPGLTQ